MENSTHIGMNKTGAQMAPRGVPQMREAVDEFPPETGNGISDAQMRETYIDDADRIGSVPVPGTLRGMWQTGMSKLTGRNPEVFIDKLGERLAFERSGTRLYELLMLKCRGGRSEAQVVPPLDRLEHFQREEAEHFRMLTRAMERLAQEAEHLRETKAWLEREVLAQGNA